MSTDKVNSEPSSSSEKPAQQIPLEVAMNLKAFDTALKGLEAALTEHFNIPFADHIKREPMEMARIDLSSQFTSNALVWSLLSLRGTDAKTNEALRDELDRTKKYMGRLKQAEERRKKLGLNSRVAAAVVRNALFDPQEYAEAKRRRLEEGEEEGKGEEV